MAILLQITAGRGPIECAWVAAKLTEELIRDARQSGLQADLIEEEAGPEPGTMLSALIHLDGGEYSDFASGYEGTVQWVGYSGFRPGHKRKNWFVGVQRIPVPEKARFSERDVRIETLKAGGPGGQHVNTTESAVRAVHLPTGLTAVARDERSQTMNRKRALERLAILVARDEERRQTMDRKHRWDAHNELERGNPVRIYTGHDFKLKR
jgi:peptide chain release factor